ncbi:hypothetical protein K458DRAFT_428636 [Lentithecium fluviatile CBS 122367]|uniref:Uncharacterized protein n=1 Tax=Lentithecium fluviatile CBS 122367 TaxID=1168545 RepID=A0A6G1JB73_9PLEO|nr:hypothetical protein K458DRAFT_428636 [Lentithecium fluviatile CBS 122367]
MSMMDESRILVVAIPLNSHDAKKSLWDRGWTSPNDASTMRRHPCHAHSNGHKPFGAVWPIILTLPLGGSRSHPKYTPPTRRCDAPQDEVTSRDRTLAQKKLLEFWSRVAGPWIQIWVRPLRSTVLAPACREADAHPSCGMISAAPIFPCFALSKDPEFGVSEA